MKGSSPGYSACYKSIDLHPIILVGDCNPYGGTLTAAVPDPGQIGSVCLIRPGATTHSTDGEQRLVDLPHQAAGPSQVSLRLPPDPRIAPPGWYMLFAVSADGVPSEAAWVHLS